MGNKKAPKRRIVSLEPSTADIKSEFFESLEAHFLGFPEYIINRITFPVMHIVALYTLYTLATTNDPRRVPAIIFAGLYQFLSAFGISAGCHRLWTHKTYKANFPLQCFLAALATNASLHPIYGWAINHRMHHKYTDTDADPYNSSRGFWYSHIGWMLLPSTKEFKEKAKTFDTTDLERNLVIQFQWKHHRKLVAVIRYLIPGAIFWYIFDAPLIHIIGGIWAPFIICSHVTWCVNSVAHMFGDRPYDRNISPADNPILSVFTIGEAWHNYHHTFPWDYKASEYGGFTQNPSSRLIEFCAHMGWAYDLKTVSQTLLRQRLRRTGADEQHKYKGTIQNESENYCNDFEYKTPKEVNSIMELLDAPIWGWDDATIPEDFLKVTKTLNPAVG